MVAHRGGLIGGNRTSRAVDARPIRRPGYTWPAAVLVGPRDDPEEPLDATRVRLAPRPRHRPDGRPGQAHPQDVEAGGFDGAGILDSQLLCRDTFVTLGQAASATSRLALFPAVTNPFTRHVSVLAGAMQTVEELAPGGPSS